MKFLNKIRSLPIKKRKKIFLIVLLLVFIVLLFFYVRDVQITLKEKQGEEIEEYLEIQAIQGKINEIREKIFQSKN